MSLIPNREPGTPLMSFQGMGKYNKKVNKDIAKGLRRQGEQGVSALMLDRNLS